MSDRMQVDFAKRSLGTTSGWDGNIQCIWFYAFKPHEGVSLKPGTLFIDTEDGYIFCEETDGTTNKIDLITFLATIPRQA